MADSSPDREGDVTGGAAPVPPGIVAYSAERREYLEYDACRRGFLVLAKDGATLPAYCISCGEAVSGMPVRRRYAWHDPSWFILLAAMPLIYLIARPFLVKRGWIMLSVCSRHQQQETNVILARWGLVITGSFICMVSLLVLGITNNFAVYMTIFLVGFVLLTVALFFKGVFGLVRPHRIERGILELQGFSPKFLEKLPDISPPSARKIRRANAESERSNV